MPRSCSHWPTASADRHVSAPRSTAFPARRRPRGPCARRPPPSPWARPADRSPVKRGNACHCDSATRHRRSNSGPMNCSTTRFLPSSAASIRYSSAITFSPGATPAAMHRSPWRGWARSARAPRASSWAPACSRPPSAITRRWWRRPSARLGAMFPERVILGVGTGESLNEVPASGLVWPEPKERTARLKEALALIRQLWSEPRVSFKGEYYRTDRATIYDKPAVAPPIYVAAAGPVLGEVRGPVRGWIHLHQRQGAGAVPRYLAAQGGGGEGGGRPQPRRTST